MQLLIYIPTHYTGVLGIQAADNGDYRYHYFKDCRSLLILPS